MKDPLRTSQTAPPAPKGDIANADARWLRLALALIALFLLSEVTVSFLARSLALLSDAAHMLTDVGALVLALVAVRFAKRPAEGFYTYGLKRVEILSAQANGLTLLILAVLFTIEAVRRLARPPAVIGGPVLAVSLAGIAVNLLASWCLSRANRAKLNIKGAYEHVFTDLFGFIATAVAGAVILAVHWARADALASLAVVALMVRAGYRLVRDSGRIFLEAAPASIDPAQLGASLAARPGVGAVHDLHVWQITSGMPAVSAHITVESQYDCHAVQQDLQQVLRDEHHIDHTTLQVEHRADRWLRIEPKPGRSASPARPQ